jgi:hypothetical protein
MVDPVVEVSVIKLRDITRLWGSSQETIRPVTGTCNVYKVKVEEEDGYYPAVDAGTWCNVGVGKHAFDVACVNFDDEVTYTYQVESQC